MSQPNPTNTSPMASCTRSRSTGRPTQPTEMTKPMAKPTFAAQQSRYTTSTPSHRTMHPRKSTPAAPRASTPAANFGAAFFTIVAGRNVTPRQEAVALYYNRCTTPMTQACITAPALPPSPK
jgi:hypothetical protein